MANISVLGAGGWGLALSIAALHAGGKPSVWTPFPEELSALCERRESARLLPGVKIPEEIEITGSLSSIIKKSDFVIIATPSHAVRETAARLKEYSPEVVVCVAKGIESGTLLRLSQVIESELPKTKTVVLSGPSHAEEVARGMETSLVSSSKSVQAAELVRTALASDKLRIYTNPDMIGVELGGALKNVIAIASGFCEGLGLGDNARAALITRGLAEIARLGAAMGADERTFTGLTGLGDLIVTCTSRHSRNHRFGKLVGEGVEVAEALSRVGTVEGYFAAETAWRLIERYGASMPIIELCYKVMYENYPVEGAVKSLMTRPYKSEIAADLPDRGFSTDI